MTFAELLDHCRHGYWASLLANPEYLDPNSPTLLKNLENAPTFYDYLLQRGFSKQQLSAYGIGKDVQA